MHIVNRAHLPVVVNSFSIERDSSSFEEIIRKRNTVGLEGKDENSVFRAKFDSKRLKILLKTLSGVYLTRKICSNRPISDHLTLLACLRRGNVCKIELF